LQKEFNGTGSIASWKKRGFVKQLFVPWEVVVAIGNREKGTLANEEVT